MILASFLDAITDPATLLMTLLMFFGVMLIIIILLQKGRGGGLAGAFGGAGGQSALGTKAGDVFTKITIVMAVIWVILSGVSGIVTRASSNSKYKGGAAVTPEDPEMVNNDKTEKDAEAATAEEDAKSEFNTNIPEAPAKPDAEPKPAADKAAKPAEEATKSEPKTDSAKSAETKPAPEKKPETPAETGKPATEPKSE
ncbi:MAG: preprotein translocase subunit SecG [bacterium]|nr:preprotein translocase subunit SecG [bacterium]